MGSTLELLNEIRHTLETDPAVVDLVGSRIYLDHSPANDIRKGPAVILDLRGGSDAPQAAVGSRVVHVYTYSPNGLAGALALYEAVKLRLNRRGTNKRLTTGGGRATGMDGYGIELEGPDSGYNDVVSSWFCRGDWRFWGFGEDPTGDLVAPSNAVPPAILGTRGEGLTLSSFLGIWGGTEPLSFAVAWQLKILGVWTTSGTDRDWTDDAASMGRELRLLVAATGPGGGPVEAASQALPGTAEEVAPVIDGLPVITGPITSGYTITATAAPLSAGSEPIVTTLQIYADGAPIPGATGESPLEYLIEDAFAGAVLTVEQTSANTFTDTATSAPTAPVGAAVAPSIVVYPTIDTERGDGITVGVNVGEWSGSAITGYAYQWQLWTAGAWVSVAGATGTASTWTDTATTALQHLRCLVSGTNAAGTVQVASIPAWNPQANDSEWFIDLADLVPYDVVDLGAAGGVYGGAQPAHPLDDGTIQPGTDARLSGECALWLFDLADFANRFNGAPLNVDGLLDARAHFRLEFEYSGCPDDINQTGVTWALLWGRELAGVPFRYAANTASGCGVRTFIASGISARNSAICFRATTATIVGSNTIIFSNLVGQLKYGVGHFAPLNANANDISFLPSCLLRPNPIGSLPYDATRDSPAQHDIGTTVHRLGERWTFAVMVTRDNGLAATTTQRFTGVKIFLGRNMT